MSLSVRLVYEATRRPAHHLHRCRRCGRRITSVYRDQRLNVAGGLLTVRTHLECAPYPDPDPKDAA